MTEHKVIFGDSRNLSRIADKSVQLIITSPPYWQLKDYGNDQQIGFNDSYEDYINNLNLVWSECNRVLSDGCKMCVNIGDQFARSKYYGRYKVIPIRTEIIRFCETLGMDYMGAIIWQKTTTMNTSGGGAVMGSFPYPRNGILKMDYEFILIFKKQGKAPKPTKEQKENSAMTKEEWKEYFSSHWYFGGVRQLEHIAMFPEELPKRLIKMFSFAEETVFDPFAGSGTTGNAVLKYNAEHEGSARRFILCTNNENGICRDVTYERIRRVIDKEDYAASLKYYKVGYVPISDRMYYEYADELLRHIRELVELENGINFTGNEEIAIVLTDEELEIFLDDEGICKRCRKLYMGHDVLLDAQQAQALQEYNIAVNVIPDYYYKELEG